MSLDSARVWVIDDDIELRMAVSRLLHSVGLQVHCSPSATEFLAEVRLADIDCVLTDVRMPGMTGIELVAVLSRLAVHPPVIVMTLHGDAASAVRAMKAGAFDFIEKPLRELDLIELVHKAIARGRRQRVRQEQRERARSAVQGLSPREREVLDSVVRGRMNKEIAKALEISVRTVELHRASVMDKTGCASLPELVTLVLTARGAAEDEAGGSGSSTGGFG